MTTIMTRMKWFAYRTRLLSLAWLGIVAAVVVLGFDTGRAEDLNVRWESSARQSVLVKWNPPSREISACLEGGFTYAVRYEFKVCSLRLFWWDDCQGQRLDKRLSRDPISDIISLSSDRLRDAEAPKTQEFSLLTDALKPIQQETFLIDLPVPLRVERVLKTRISATCRGQPSGFLDRIPAILTLGILSRTPNPGGSFDSGWTEFSLKE